MKSHLLVGGLVLALLNAGLHGCTDGGGSALMASNVEITSPMPGRSMSAGYLSLTNNSAQDIQITHVTSPQYGNVTLHETQLENDIARMRPIDSLIITAGNTTRLERGGKHLMLSDPIDQPHPVILNFYSGDTLLLSLHTKINEH